MEWAKILGIIIGTFVSEDLTCISTGLLIRSKELDLSTGLMACVIGIFLGDLGLFLLGRFMSYSFSCFPRLSSLSQAFYIKHKEGLERRFAREGWKLIVLARFVPGLRFPVYVGAGFFFKGKGQIQNMIFFALLAGLIWTPCIVLLSAWIGPGLQKQMEDLVGSAWLALLLAALFLYIFLRVLISLLTQEGRREIFIFFRKILRIEFWPPLLFYAPLLPLWLYCALRYRSLYTISASNPGIEMGGLLGESKSAILSLMPQEWVLDWLFIPSLESIQKESAKKGNKKKNPNPTELRYKILENRILRYAKEKKKKAPSSAKPYKKWTFPLVLKPDQGQRGRGVKIVQNTKEAREYLEQVPQALIAQVYHPGPFEAGIFYYRRPSEKNGRIFSITDKVFPELKGDGASTLEELIWSHPRYAMQAKTFLNRIKQKKENPERILKKGEAFPLSKIGNHVQGTMFRDASHLYSRALEKKLDTIAKKTKGFYFGRFDLRYRKKEELTRGLAFGILELNGASSESTNIYDPSFSIFQVYQTLYRQWQLLCEIAYANRKYKEASTSPLKLLAMIWEYHKIQKAPRISD